MDHAFDGAWVEQCEPAEVYKQDARSRVWRIDAPDGRSYVVKRFEYSPLRQALGAALGLHPGQSERRRCGPLITAGIGVVPIVATGVERTGVGIRYWLATPYVGKSLYNLLYHGDLTDADRRVRILDAVGRLTGGLIRQGFFNRDHKASNILVDREDRPILIDYGSVRWHRGPADTDRMLRNLQANLSEAGADEADWQRVSRACEQVVGQAGGNPGGTDGTP